jgi:peptidoglycan DL-endopeptidase CwlO
VSHVPTRLAGSRNLISPLWRRGVAVPLGLLAIGGLVLSVGGSAAAAPQTTPAQVQAKLSQLNQKAQQLDEEYDAAQQALASANQQLNAINTEIARDQTRFKVLRKGVAEIAAMDYETGAAQTPESLITSDNPQQILDEASILEELSTSNGEQMNEFLTAARQLSGAQQSAQRIKDGKLALAAQLRTEKNQNNQMIAQQQALLAQLTPQQQAAVGFDGAGEGVPIAQGSAPTSAQAAKAIQFAEAQLGCPYVYGGTGPCDPSQGEGFDCSGLTQAAWAAAGVSIPRTSYEQMADLPSVPLNELEPGDILGFLDNGHVAIYIGNNQLLQSPETGEDVDVEDLTGWFAQNLDGAVRP